MFYSRALNESLRWDCKHIYQISVEIKPLSVIMTGFAAQPAKIVMPAVRPVELDAGKANLLAIEFKHWTSDCVVTVHFDE